MLKKLTYLTRRADREEEKRREIKERIAASSPLCLLACAPEDPKSTNIWNDLYDP